MINPNMKYVWQKYCSMPIQYGAEFTKLMSLVESDKLIKNHKQEVLFKLNVKDSMNNIFDTMHGGALMTMLDITTTLAISGLDKTMRHTVSIEMAMSFLNAIKSPSNILFHCRIPKIGKSLAFSYCDIYDEKTRVLCATGQQVKIFLNQTWKE